MTRSFATPLTRNDAGLQGDRAGRQPARRHDVALLQHLEQRASCGILGAQPQAGKFLQDHEIARGHHDLIAVARFIQYCTADNAEERMPGRRIRRFAAPACLIRQVEPGAARGADHENQGHGSLLLDMAGAPRGARRVASAVEGLPGSALM
jgi:hypothetical protein